MTTVAWQPTNGLLFSQSRAPPHPSASLAWEESAPARVEVTAKAAPPFLFSLLSPH